MPKLPPHQKVTEKEAKAVKELVVNHTSKREAIRRAFNPKTENTIKSMANEVFNKPRVQAFLKEELERAEINSSYLAKKVKEGLESEDWEGKPDMGMRHKYLDTALKVRGDYAATEQKTTNVQVNITDKLFKDLDQGVIDA